MDDVLTRLLASGGRYSPAPKADIIAVSNLFDAPLPGLLRDLWRRSDGLALPDIDANILGPSEVDDVVRNGAWFTGLAELGLVPVLDDHNSNYVVVSVRGPLAFRVLHMPHDDGSRMLYREIESFFLDLLRAIEKGDRADIYFHEAKGDYEADAPRSEEDQEAAKALLSTDGEHQEWNDAIQLLDAASLDEWARVLETDHFVRRDARKRMRAMFSPAIQALLRRDQEAFDAFAQLAADAARSAGLVVGERHGDALQVGDSWMGLESFFHRRNIPNAIPRMIDWFKDLIDGRHPSHRPGNFMMD